MAEDQFARLSPREEYVYLLGLSEFFRENYLDNEQLGLNIIEWLAKSNGEMSNSLKIVDQT
jgi:hypothetical protein